MAAKLEKTGTPGVFRRHAKGCDRKGRCDCAYVIVWRHRGRQHTETYPHVRGGPRGEGQP